MRSSLLKVKMVYKVLLVLQGLSVLKDLLDYKVLLVLLEMIVQAHLWKALLAPKAPKDLLVLLAPKALLAQI